MIPGIGNIMFSGGASEGTPYMLAELEYVQKIDVTSVVTNGLNSLFFKPDGTELYLWCGDFGGQYGFYTYTLSIAWDISTASYQSFSSTGSDGYSAFWIKPDGTKLYRVSGTGVREYTLSTAWDLSSRSTSYIFSTTGQSSGTSDIFIDSTGTYMFICDRVGLDIYRYSMSTPWDLSTASYDSNSYDTSGDFSYPRHCNVSDDGYQLYIGDKDGGVKQYTMSTQWDLTSTGSLIAYHSGGGSQTTCTKWFKSGEFLYNTANNDQKIWQYQIPNIP